MKLFKLIGIGFIAVLLSGCFLTPGYFAEREENVRMVAGLKLLADRPIVCDNKTQCDEWWQKAEFFVNKHAGMRIRSVTDTVIETYGSTDYTRMSFTVSKEPLGDGKARIFVKAYCKDGICDGGWDLEKAHEMAIKAKKYISGVPQ